MAMSTSRLLSNISKNNELNFTKIIGNKIAEQIAYYDSKKGLLRKANSLIGRDEGDSKYIAALKKFNLGQDVCHNLKPSPENHVYHAEQDNILKECEDELYLYNFILFQERYFLKNNKELSGEVFHHLNNFILDLVPYSVLKGIKENSNFHSRNHSFEEVAIIRLMRLLQEFCDNNPNVDRAFIDRRFPLIACYFIKILPHICESKQNSYLHQDKLKLNSFLLKLIELNQNVPLDLYSDELRKEKEFAIKNLLILNNLSLVTEENINRMLKQLKWCDNPHFIYMCDWRSRDELNLCTQSNLNAYLDGYEWWNKIKVFDRGIRLNNVALSRPGQEYGCFYKDILFSKAVYNLSDDLPNYLKVLEIYFLLGSRQYNAKQFLDIYDTHPSYFFNCADQLLDLLKNEKLTSEIYTTLTAPMIVKNMFELCLR